MEVTYTQTKEDLAAFRRFHARHRTKGRSLTLFFNGLLVVIWAVQALLIARILYSDRFLLEFGPRVWGFVLRHHQHLLVNFLILTLLLAYLFWGQKMLLARQTGGSAQFMHPKTLRIGPEGVHVVNRLEQATVAWKDIPDIGSDRDSIYLYLTKTTALVVPRRAFQSPQQSQVFEAQARAFRDSPAALALPGADAETDSGVWPPRPVFRAAPAPRADPFPNMEDAPGAIVLPYVTTRADLVRSQWFFLPRRPAAWLGAFIPYALVAGTWTVPRLPLAAALGLAVLIAALATLLQLAWVVKKNLAQRFAKFAQGRPCRTIARADFLCDITPEGRKIYFWPDVSAVQMQAGDIYVMGKGIGGMVIPRTAFANPLAAREFAQTLRTFWQAGKDSSPAQASPLLELSQTKNERT